MFKFLLPMISVICMTAGCIAGGGVYAVHGDLPPAERTQKSAFTIISWNISKRAPDAIDMNRLINEFAPDVICLQEATDRTLDALQPHFSSGYFGGSWRRLGSRTQNGLALASRYDVTVPAFFRSPARELFVFTPKSAMMAFVNVPGDKKLLVINVHALNFMPAAFLQSQLRVLHAAAAGHEGPLVVCGDFNTWNGARIKVVQQFAAKLGLVEALAYHESGGTPSWWAYLADPLIEIQVDAVLDRIFCRGINVTECRRLEAFTGSDHPPLLLRGEIL